MIAELHLLICCEITLAYGHLNLILLEIPKVHKFVGLFFSC